MKTHESPNLAAHRIFVEKKSSQISVEPGLRVRLQCLCVDILRELDQFLVLNARRIAAGESFLQYTLQMGPSILKYSSMAVSNAASVGTEFSSMRSGKMKPNYRFHI